MPMRYVIFFMGNNDILFLRGEWEFIRKKYFIEK